MDGAIWRAIEPLLEERGMPVLAHRIERGYQYGIAVVEPLLSSIDKRPLPEVWMTLLRGVGYRG